MESPVEIPADPPDQSRPALPHAYTLTRWLFLRALALVYFFAFASLATQILGLYGSQGIAPIHDYLQAVQQSYGSEAYRLLPSVLWLNASDPALQFVTLAGMVIALLLLVDVAPMLCTLVLWGLYLSLVSAGQVFLSFQWDILLLETGFLAIFLAPPHLIPRVSQQRSPARLNIWLFRWLLFRLMFSSGVVKLASGDPTWHNLTALEYHYWTQPLPTPLAWYAHLLPDAIQRLSAGMMFMIELVLPFLIFGPRRLRFVAAGGIIGLQVLIGLTGNYTFFNGLTIALCLLLFDDSFLRRFVPRRWRERFQCRSCASATLPPGHCHRISGRDSAAQRGTDGPAVEPSAPAGGTAARLVGHSAATAHRQRLRSLRRDDHHPARNRGRGQQ